MPAFCFLHVPKTAGTALVQALVEPGCARPRAGYDRSMFGGFTGFDTLSPWIREEFALSADEVPAAGAFVAGHFALSTLRSRHPGLPAMTLLREPRARLLSHWMHWRRMPDAEIDGWGDWAERIRRARGGLGGFLADPALACQTDNLATRMLLWPHPAIPPDGFIPFGLDRRLARLARARLRSLAFVGVVEDPALFARLSAWLGRTLAPVRENVGVAMPPALCRPIAGELDPAALGALDARSRLDDRLWRAVAARALGAAAVEAARARALLVDVARHAAVMG